MRFTTKICTGCFDWLFSVNREENEESYYLEIVPEDERFEAYTLKVTRLEQELLNANIRKLSKEHNFELLRANCYKILGRKTRSMLKLNQNYFL